MSADLEREAQLAAREHRKEIERHYYTDNERATKQLSYEAGYIAAATLREKELRELRLLAEQQLTTLRKLKAEMLSDTRDAEIASLRAKAAEEGKVRMPKVRELIRAASSEVVRCSLEQGGVSLASWKDRIDAALAELDAAEGVKG